jgi:hypothetical protein
VAEWTFPNAIAASVRRTAELRGQHADRIEIRDWDDNWPPAKSVARWERCSGTGGVFIHEPVIDGSFCKHCRALIAG